MEAAGFLGVVLASTSQRLFQRLKKEKEEGLDAVVLPPDKRKKFVVIPYLHSVSHRLKKIAGHYDVNVVFRAGKKLGSVCASVEKRAQKGQAADSTEGCSMKHANRFTDCARGVVYSIPLSCGGAYIGQTGRCLNVRLREHASSLKGTPSTHLSLHCRQCGCAAELNKTAVVMRHRDQRTHEIAEAFEIIKARDRCVSQPSIALTEAEITYLQHT